MSLTLYGYWRSSATYRVRIALNVKKIRYAYHPVSLITDGGEQHQAEYIKLNPSQLVPTLVDDDADIQLNQSLAIIEYVDERYDTGIKLLPEHRIERARVRAMAMDLACDVQPLGNLRVLQKLQTDFGANDAQVAAWHVHWMEQGLEALEKRIAHKAGKYALGSELSLVDIMLVPQVYNALRYEMDMTAYPLVNRIYQNCQKLAAFQRAAPENQSDAP